MWKLLYPLLSGQRVSQALKRFIRLVLRDHGDNVLSIVLFGSRARGDYTRHSDVDVLVVLAEGTLHRWASGLRIILPGRPDLEPVHRPLRRSQADIAKAKRINGVGAYPELFPINNLSTGLSQSWDEKCIDRWRYSLMPLVSTW